MHIKGDTMFFGGNSMVEFASNQFNSKTCHFQMMHVCNDFQVLAGKRRGGGLKAEDPCPEQGTWQSHSLLSLRLHATAAQHMIQQVKEGHLKCLPFLLPESYATVAVQHMT